MIPRGGVGKLLRSWRGPFEFSEASQEGRWYILDNGTITHFQRPEQEEIILDDEERERQPTEEIEPEDDISTHGTFDAETNSGLSFTAPFPKQVEPSDRILRPRTRIDYHKIENPDDFELFAIMGASRMEEDDNSVMTRMTMKLAALRHEDDYESINKVTKWLVDQIRTAEEPSTRVLQIGTLDRGDPLQKISLPPTASKPDYSDLEI